MKTQTETLEIAELQGLSKIEITYTAEDIKEAFEAGANRNNYEAEGFDAEYFAPDFEQFMNGLYTYKSRL